MFIFVQKYKILFNNHECLLCDDKQRVKTHTIIMNVYCVMINNGLKHIQFVKFFLKQQTEFTQNIFI